MTLGLFGLSLHDYVVGAWAITRRIDDTRAGAVLHFEGQATFEADGQDTLAYREDGTLDTGAGVLRASRHYRWVFHGGAASVYFADGRFFHGIVPVAQAARASHDCPPDLYDVAYTFDTPEQWRQVWRVHGPRKDYTLESIYTRLHRPPLPLHSPP